MSQRPKVVHEFELFKSRHPENVDQRTMDLGHDFSIKTGTLDKKRQNKRTKNNEERLFVTNKFDLSAGDNALLLTLLLKYAIVFCTLWWSEAHCNIDLRNFFDKSFIDSVLLMRRCRTWNGSVR